MSSYGDAELFPITLEDEERQLHLAIMQSLQEMESNNASSGPTQTEEKQTDIKKPPDGAKEASASTSKPRNFKRANTTALFQDTGDESPQTMLRRSMSIGNGSPPRPTFLTDCCEVKSALAARNKEYIRCLVASWGRVTSPIHSSVMVGHNRCLEDLLRAFPDLINSTNTNGETPLYLATIHSQEIAVKQLLQSGKHADIIIANIMLCQADPDMGRNAHDTPLLAAVDNDCREVALELIKSGADVNRPLNRGWTVLHEAVYRGHTDSLQVLLGNGGDPNIRDCFGISPVFTSAACGRNECLEMLLRSGGDPNLCAESKMASPLYEACKEGHLDCVITLLDNGANPHLVNCDGLYPIHVASSRGFEKIVEKLLPITDVTMAESCGMSPVHSAAKGDNIEILSMLIGHGYDVNIKLTRDKITYRDRRQTALFFAVYNDSEEATEILLEAGAETELDYVKPLLVAVSHSQYDMADLLLSYGADVNACFNEDGAYFPACVAFALRDFRMLKQVLVSGCDVTKCLKCDIGGQDHSRFSESVRRQSFCHFLTDDHQRAWCGCTVRYLLQFVGNVKLCSRILEAVQNSDEWEEIEQLTDNPRSLRHLCRLKIRSAVGIRALRHEETFQNLPVPEPLRRYLLFSNVQ